MPSDILPFRMAGNLYFVGTRAQSSHLIDTGDGLILMDVGVEGRRGNPGEAARHRRRRALPHRGPDQPPRRGPLARDGLPRTGVGSLAQDHGNGLRQRRRRHDRQFPGPPQGLRGFQSRIKKRLRDQLGGISFIFKDQYPLVAKSKRSARFSGL